MRCKALSSIESFFIFWLRFFLTEIGMETRYLVFLSQPPVSNHHITTRLSLLFSEITSFPSLQFRSPPPNLCGHP